VPDQVWIVPGGPPYGAPRAFGVGDRGRDQGAVRGGDVVERESRPGGPVDLERDVPIEQRRCIDDRRGLAAGDAAPPGAVGVLQVDAHERPPIDDPHPAPDRTTAGDLGRTGGYGQVLAGVEVDQLDRHASTCCDSGDPGRGGQADRSGEAGDTYGTTAEGN
jgi:hypothetical protein